MDFCGRMPMGFSGAVSLISCAPGLDLMFMVVTRSNFSVFSTAGFIVSPVGKRERGGEKKKEEGKSEKGNRKGKEGRKKE